MWKHAHHIHILILKYQMVRKQSNSKLCLHTQAHTEQKHNDSSSSCLTFYIADFIDGFVCNTCSLHITHTKTQSHTRTCMHVCRTNRSNGKVNNDNNKMCRRQWKMQPKFHPCLSVPLSVCKHFSWHKWIARTQLIYRKHIANRQMDMDTRRKRRKDCDSIDLMEFICVWSSKDKNTHHVRMEIAYRRAF